MTATRIQRRPLQQITSREAFRAVDPDTIDGRILAHIEAHRGATVAELVSALKIPHQTASAQVAHLHERKFLPDGTLVREPLIHASGDKRRTPSGRRAIVWLIGPGPALAPFVRPNAITEQIEMPGVRA